MSITEDPPMLKKQHSVAQKGAEDCLLAPLADDILSNSPQQSDTELNFQAFNKERQISKGSNCSKNLNRFVTYSNKSRKTEKKVTKTMTWHGKHTIYKAHKVQAQTALKHKLAMDGAQPPKRKMISKNVL